MLVVSLPTYNLARISPPLWGAALWRPRRCSPAGCPARTRGMRPSVDSSMAPGHILGQPSARSLGIGSAGQVAACTRIDTRNVGSRGPRSRRPSSMRDSGCPCAMPGRHRVLPSCRSDYQRPRGVEVTELPHLSVAAFHHLNLTAVLLSRAIARSCTRIAGPLRRRCRQYRLRKPLGSS